SATSGRRFCTRSTPPPKKNSAPAKSARTTASFARQTAVKASRRQGWTASIRFAPHWGIDYFELLSFEMKNWILLAALLGVGAGGYVYWEKWQKQKTDSAPGSHPTTAIVELRDIHFAVN